MRQLDQPLNLNATVSSQDGHIFGTKFDKRGEMRRKLYFEYTGCPYRVVASVGLAWQQRHFAVQSPFLRHAASMIGGVDGYP
jgi:hypothetical protein